MDTAGRNKKVIEEYKNHTQEDLRYQQLTLKEYEDSFASRRLRIGK